MKQVSVSFEVPDREPGEPSITDDEIARLKALGDFDTEALRTLGRWQAAVLIQCATARKEGLEWKLAGDMQKQRREKGCAWWLLIGLLLFVALWLATG